MTGETITLRQAICIIIVFIFGSTIVFGVGTTSEQDSWISFLFAAVEAIPILLVYARLMKLFPEKNIFEILEALFGKALGKIFTVLICWYAIHLGALVVRNFSEFIALTGMPETPQLPVMIMMLLVAAYITKSGVETLGKWSITVFPTICIVIIITVLLSLDRIDLSNLQPVFGHSLNSLLTGSFPILTFPFAETVLFLAVAGAVKKTDNPKRIYISALAISTLILLVVVIRNYGMLGPKLLSSEYFPSYTAARMIHPADYLMRIEGFIVMNFIFTGATKITVCLFAASKGLSSLFGIKDYKQMVMPAGLLTLALCAIVYKSVMEMYDFIKPYTYYALPFEVAIPLIAWITAEIKNRKKKPATGT